jgi:hypothetical protein
MVYRFKRCKSERTVPYTIKFIPFDGTERLNFENTFQPKMNSAVRGMITGGLGTLTSGGEGTYLRDIDQILIQNLRHNGNYY